MAKTTKGKEDLSKLSKYSVEHQLAILKMLVEDSEFIAKANDLINENFLGKDEALRYIAHIIKEYNSKSAVFTYSTLRSKVEGSVSDLVKRDMCFSYLDKMEKQQLPMSAIEYLKKDVYNLLTIQETMKLTGQLTDMLKAEKVNKSEVMNIINDYNQKTTFNECGYEVLDSSIDEVDRLVTTETYEYVPTSSRVINMALGGGLRKGDVGILLAGSGVAKTCMTTSFVAGNALKGKKIVHVVLEDKADDIKRKYLAFITGISPYEQYKRRDEVHASVMEQKDNYSLMLSNIRGVYACKANNKCREMTTYDIDRELQRIFDSGFKADMVVVDYFDRIKKSKDQIWVEDQRIINELLDIATKYNVALWLPSQGGKAAQNRNVDMTLDLMSGGTWKTYAAQIVISIQKKTDDMDDMYTLNVLKNRYFRGSQTMKLSFDNGCCMFNNEQHIIEQMNLTDDALRDMYDNYRLQMAKQTKNEYNG